MLSLSSGSHEASPVSKVFCPEDGAVHGKRPNSHTHKLEYDRYQRLLRSNKCPSLNSLAESDKLGAFEVFVSSGGDLDMLVSVVAQKSSKQSSRAATSLVTVLRSEMPQRGYTAGQIEAICKHGDETGNFVDDPYFPECRELRRYMLFDKATAEHAHEVGRSLAGVAESGLTRDQFSEMVGGQGILGSNLAALGQVAPEAMGAAWSRALCLHPDALAVVEPAAGSRGAAGAGGGRRAAKAKAKSRAAAAREAPTTAEQKCAEFVQKARKQADSARWFGVALKEHALAELGTSMTGHSQKLENFICELRRLQQNKDFSNPTLPQLYEDMEKAFKWFTGLEATCRRLVSDLGREGGSSAAKRSRVAK